MAKVNKVAEKFYLAALEFFEKEQYKKAFDYIQKAINNDPQNADYVATKAIFFHKINELHNALETYQQALSINPNHILSHFNLGIIYMKVGKYIEAINEWQAVLKSNPTDSEALFNIAVALTKINKKNEAVTLFEKVLQINPNHAQAHQNLAILYKADKNYQKAKYHLQKLKELDITFSEIATIEMIKCNELEFLDKLCEQSNTSNIIKETLNVNISTTNNNISTTNIETLQTNALCALIDENFAEAITITEQILKQDPNNIQALLIRGQAYFRTGQYENSIADFKTAINLNPSLAEPHFHLATVYLHTEDLHQALENFERCARLDPNYPLVNENIQNLRTKLKT